MFTAGEFCNRQVVTATADELATAVARRMRDHHVGTVVVVEQRDERVVPIGLLTDRDLVVGLLAVDPGYIANAVVGDLLSGKIVTATEGMDLYEAVARMRSHGIRRLPVVNQAGALQGLIAFDDVVAEIADELRNLSLLLQREGENERRGRPVAQRLAERGARRGDQHA